METFVTKEKLNQFEERFDADRVNLVAMNAVTSNGCLLYTSDAADE